MGIAAAPIKSIQVQSGLFYKTPGEQTSRIE